MLLGWCSGCEVGREGNNDWVVDDVDYMLSNCMTVTVTLLKLHGSAHMFTGTFSSL